MSKYLIDSSTLDSIAEAIRFQTGLTDVIKVSDFATKIKRILKNFVIRGNSVQNGTPTPSTPIEINHVGNYDATTGKYKVPVKVNNTTYTAYLNKPLRKVGNCTDKLFRANDGSLRIERNVGTHMIDSTYTWTQNSLKTGYYCNDASRKQINYATKIGATQPSLVMSKVFGPDSGSSYEMNKIGIASSGVLWVGVDVEVYSTESSIKKIVDNMLIYYQRATPIIDTNVSWLDGKEPVIGAGDTIKILTDVQPSDYVMG